MTWRRQYLKCILQLRSEGRKIFYLDETFLNAGHTVKKAWIPTYIKSARQAFMAGETTGLKNLPGRGGRLIVVHIGNEDGFLKDPNNPTKDARLIFQANKKTNLGGTDYDDEMTGACFEEWFQNVLSMLPVRDMNR